MFDQIKKAIRESKVCHIPNAIVSEQKIDFNYISSLLNNSNCKNKIKVDRELGANENDILSNPFQIRKVENANHIAPLHKIICEGLPDLKIDQADIFFSMKRSVGVAHVDRENSLILGVYKNTIYRFENQDLTVVVKPGDLLLSPSGHTHFAMSYQERIIISWGLYTN
jgi:hypothetical protein